MEPEPLATSRGYQWGLKEAPITSNTKTMTKRLQQRFQNSPQTVWYLLHLYHYKHLKEIWFWRLLTPHCRDQSCERSLQGCLVREETCWAHHFSSTCRLTCCWSLSEHRQNHVIAADLFSLTRSFGNFRRRSSPLQSRPTWPWGSLCSPRWSPSSPLTPSWPLSASSYDPGDKLNGVHLFYGVLPTVLLT